MLLIGMMSISINAQTDVFPSSIEMPPGFTPEEVLLPPSPLSLQVIFVGGHDLVQTTRTYGNEPGIAYAKEWHDFIGFTPDDTGESLGWVSVNHEQIYRDDRIGDGGGMTVFRVDRNPLNARELVIMEQSLADGRKGKFFNVDFVNTVGETGMNCGGISSLNDGRIWTAEEWFRGNNNSINAGTKSNPESGAYPNAPGVIDNQGVRDTADWVVDSDIPGFDGITLKKYENFNYMVEIDPKEAVALRKQYNWGRQGFEGGTIAADNKTVYLGVDATPAFWVKFVADNAGDFTSGTTYVYKHDGNPKWIEIPNNDPEKMLNFADEAVAAEATMYNRIEWVAIDPATGIIYMTETGRDNPGSRWVDEAGEGAVYAPHHLTRAADQGVTDPADEEYWDYYGRVLKFDPNTEEISVVLEGGPYFENSPDEANYPSNHLSNPDGINTMTIDGQSFLIIQEDLNGTSNGRVPEGVSNRTCEVYLLDLSIDNPSIDDLVRLTAVPSGAEVTGAMPTPDGKSLLINSQHASVGLEFPWNHSLTFAIHGFDELTVTDLQDPDLTDTQGLSIYPNPTTRVVFVSEVTDMALYSIDGQRLKVVRNTNELDVSDYPSGAYLIQFPNGEVKKLIIE